MLREVHYLRSSDYRYFLNIMASAFRSLVGSKCLKALDKTCVLNPCFHLKHLVPNMRLQEVDVVFNPLRISLPIDSLPDRSPAFVSSFIQDFEVDESVPSIMQDPDGTNLLFSVDRTKFFSMELLNQLCYDKSSYKWISDDLFTDKQELNILVEFRYNCFTMAVFKFITKSHFF